ELSFGGEPRVGRRHSTGDESFRRALEVLAHLRLHGVVERASAKDRAKAEHYESKERHAAGLFGRQDRRERSLDGLVRAGVSTNCQAGRTAWRAGCAAPGDAPVGDLEGASQAWGIALKTRISPCGAEVGGARLMKLCGRRTSHGRRALA